METKTKKQSIGRQKIEIKKIEKKSQLQVSFSKRRKGLFKKVAELSTLCGTDAAVLVQSPGGKLFAFGSPSPKHVIKRYLGLSKVDDHHHSSCSSDDVLSRLHDDSLEKLGFEEQLHGEKLGVEEELQKEKLRVEEELKKKKKEEENEENEVFWWRKKNVDGLGLGELEEMKNALEGLKKKIAARREQMVLEMIMELEEDDQSLFFV